MNRTQAKKSRGGRRAAITKLLAQLQESIKKEEVENVEEQLARLMSKEVTLTDLDKTIEVLTPEEELDAEIEEVERYSDHITAWKVRVNQFLESKRQARRVSNASSSVGSSNAMPECSLKGELQYGTRVTTG